MKEIKLEIKIDNIKDLSNLIKEIVEIEKEHNINCTLSIELDSTTLGY